MNAVHTAQCIKAKHNVMQTQTKKINESRRRACYPYIDKSVSLMNHHCSMVAEQFDRFDW